MSNSRKMWFGTDTYQQWVPAPSAGMEVARQGYSARVEMENGGTWVERSRAHHRTYQMNYPAGDPRDYDGIDAFLRFDQGLYGSPLRFVDPMQIATLQGGTNILAPQWAAPTLGFRGWKPIHADGTHVSPLFAPEASTGLPGDSALFTVTRRLDVFHDTTNDPACAEYTMLIPPSHTLHVGFRGAKTGTARVNARRVQRSNGAATNVEVPLQTSGPLAWTASFNGDTYSRVTLFIARENATASTITLRGGWANIAPNGITPPIEKWTSGEGAWGCEFSGEPIVESYVYAGGAQRLVGASFGLVEVEPWRRA